MLLKVFKLFSNIILFLGYRLATLLYWISSFCFRFEYKTIKLKIKYQLLIRIINMQPYPIRVPINGQFFYAEKLLFVH